jgi:hypothetical protein
MYKINMKQIYQMIADRVRNPTVIDVVISMIITILFGNLTGEVVSRDFNAYIQASMVLITIFLAITSVRMTGIYIFNYINK